MKEYPSAFPKVVQAHIKGRILDNPISWFHHTTFPRLRHLDLTELHLSQINRHFLTGVIAHTSSTRAHWYIPLGFWWIDCVKQRHNPLQRWGHIFGRTAAYGLPFESEDHSAQPLWRAIQQVLRQCTQLLSVRISFTPQMYRRDTPPSPSSPALEASHIVKFVLPKSLEWLCIGDVSVFPENAFGVKFDISHCPNLVCLCNIGVLCHRQVVVLWLLERVTDSNLLNPELFVLPKKQRLGALIHAYQSRLHTYSYDIHEFLDHFDIQWHIYGDKIISGSDYLTNTTRSTDKKPMRLIIEQLTMWYGTSTIDRSNTDAMLLLLFEYLMRSKFDSMDTPFLYEKIKLYEHWFGPNQDCWFKELATFPDNIHPYDRRRANALITPPPYIDDNLYTFTNLAIH